VNVAGRTLVFRAVNTVRTAATTNANGDPALGLKNVRRRLELLYPGGHELHLGQADGQFTARLQLTLQ